MTTTYLGDGVSVRYEDDYVVIFTGARVTPGDCIYLDGRVWGNLQLWAKEKFGSQAFPPFSNAPRS